jgi:hypothetical protein
MMLKSIKWCFPQTHKNVYCPHRLTKFLIFRECLHAAEENPENTEGNKQAIISSFNYSVDMEERIAERFNVAIRSYKERQANQ